MARALARGWGRPVLCADPVAERAPRLAEEVGGEALARTPRSPRAADLVVLCHKPAQLQDVAHEVAPDGQGRRLDPRRHARCEALHDAYPDRPVYRFIPSLPVEVRQGAVVQAAGPEAPTAARSDA